MEKRPEFRVVGNASQEVKELAKERLEKNSCGSLFFLTEQQKQSLENSERLKTVEELALIDFACEEINRMREEVGVVPYSLPKENVRIVSGDFSTDRGHLKDNIAGYVDKLLQKMFISEERAQFGQSRLKFGLTVVHEAFHLNGHVAVEVLQIEESKACLSIFREGVVIDPPEKKFERGGLVRYYFGGLEEALASTFEKKSLTRMINLPQFEEEKIWLMSGDAQMIVERLSRKWNFPKDEVGVVSKDGRVTLFSSYEQRQVLDYICNQIAIVFSDEYQSPDDVLKEFYKAQITGEILQIARLVENTFGKGSFRMLGEMGVEPESGTLHLELFKKAREEQKH